MSTFCHKSAFGFGYLWRKFSIKERITENLNGFLFARDEGNGKLCVRRVTPRAGVDARRATGSAANLIHIFKISSYIQMHS
jgi:hypothetical protein